jgi:hypothetical protein
VADEEKSSSRINLTILIPALAAIFGALLSFMATVYVGYLGNQSTLEIERKKEKAESDLEQQKFKTSLILEAVKVGDRQKAIDNLTFFIDAGFLDDPGGKIKALLNKNVLPVLPKVAWSLGDDYSFDGAMAGVQTIAGKFGVLSAKEGDERAAKGESDAALSSYKEALGWLENTTCDDPTAKAVREKIEQLPGKPAVAPCLKRLPRFQPANK